MAFLIASITAGGASATLHRPATGAKKAGTKNSGTKSSASASRKKFVGRKLLFARGRGGSRKRGSVPREPLRQQAPTTERYLEIEQALASKGYLSTPPNGAWDQNAQDALRRFQADQKLESTGKLTSRSLIALGLGSPSALPPPPPLNDLPKPTNP